jgi:hypothetical protein
MTFDDYFVLKQGGFQAFFMQHIWGSGGVVP